MSPLLAVILICKIGIAPEACTRATALDVLERDARTPMDCAMWSQTTAANNGLIDGQTYLVTRCEHPRG